MTERVIARVGSTTRERVAEELRVLLVRRRISATELARRMGVKQAWLSRRMTAEVPFDLDDLDLIAQTLEISPLDLLSAASRSTTLRYPPNGHGPSDGRPATRTPAGPGRAARTRPTVAV